MRIPLEEIFCSSTPPARSRGRTDRGDVALRKRLEVALAGRSRRRDGGRTRAGSTRSVLVSRLDPEQPQVPVGFRRCPLVCRRDCGRRTLRVAQAAPRPQDRRTRRQPVARLSRPSHRAAPTSRPRWIREAVHQASRSRSERAPRTSRCSAASAAARPGTGGRSAGHPRWKARAMTADATPTSSGRSVCTEDSSTAHQRDHLTALPNDYSAIAQVDRRPGPTQSPR